MFLKRTVGAKYMFYFLDAVRVEYTPCLKKTASVIF